MVHRSHRDRNFHQSELCQLREQVNVANDERRFGGDHYGMLGFEHHFEDATGQPVLAFDRLVRVGIGAHGDWLGSVRLARQFGSQRFDSVDLHIDVALKLDSCRMPQVGVAGARKAIRAPMLAPTIRVDRTFKPDVRTIIAGDYRLGAFHMFDGLKYGLWLGAGPAVIYIFASVGLKPTATI